MEGGGSDRQTVSACFTCPTLWPTSLLLCQTHYRLSPKVTVKWQISFKAMTDFPLFICLLFDMLLYNSPSTAQESKTKCPRCFVCTVGVGRV